MLKPIALAVVLSIVLSGCTSALSNQSIREADDNIAFPDLQRQPERYRGAVVIFGGQILETVVKEGETRVQVLQLPLGSQQRPDNMAASQGRFIVLYKRFADPLVYEKGRKITVAGVVEGGQVMMLNDRPYSLPVLLERETHLWKTEDYYPAYAPGPAVQFGIGVGVGR
jgi:outer membrane lipoprotein